MTTTNDKNDISTLADAMSKLSFATNEGSCGLVYPPKLDPVIQGPGKTAMVLDRSSVAITKEEQSVKTDYQSHKKLAKPPVVKPLDKVTEEEADFNEHEIIDLNFVENSHLVDSRDSLRRERYIKSQERKRQRNRRKRGRKAHPQGGGLDDMDDNEEYDEFFETGYGLDSLFPVEGRYESMSKKAREYFSKRFGSAARVEHSAALRKRSTSLLKSCSARMARDIVVLDANQAQVVLVRISGMITALAQAASVAEMSKIALGIGCQYVSGENLKWLNATIRDNLIIPQDSSLKALRTSIDGFQHFLTTVDEVPCFAMLKNSMLLCMYAGFKVSDYCADESLLKEYLTNFDKSIPITTLGPLNFLQVTSAMMSFTLEFIEVVQAGASIRNFLFPSTVLSRFADLTAKKDHWKTGDLVKLHGLTALEYLKELGKLDADIDLSIKKAPNSLKATYLSYSRAIKCLYNEVKAGNMIQKLKVKAMGVVYTGESQIGKTAIITNTRGVVGSAVESDLSDKNTYYVQLGAKYMSGMTNETKCIVFDDVDALNEKLRAAGSSVPVHGIHLVNGTPCPTDQAELELKGKIFPIPDLVAMSANSEDAGALADLKHPEAFFNRFIFVEVSVKEECRITGTTKIDPGKIPKDSMGRPLDAHDVRIYTFVRTGNGFRRVNGAWTTISQYYAWIGTKARKQHESEKMYVNSIENTWNTNRCKSCYSPDYMCICKNKRGIILPDIAADAAVKRTKADGLPGQKAPARERSQDSQELNAFAKEFRPKVVGRSKAIRRIRQEVKADTTLTPQQKEREIELSIAEYDAAIRDTEEEHIEMVQVDDDDDDDLSTPIPEGFAEIKGMLSSSGNFYVSLTIKYLALVKVPSVNSIVENLLAGLFLRCVGVFVRNFKSFPDLGKFVFGAYAWLMYRLLTHNNNPYWRYFQYFTFVLYWYMVVASLSRYCRILIYQEVMQSIRNKTTFMHIGTAGVAVYAVVQAITAFSRTYEKRQPEGNLMPKSAADIHARAKEQDCWSEVELLKKKAPGTVASQTLEAVTKNVGSSTVRWQCEGTRECCMGIMVDNNIILVAHHSCVRLQKEPAQMVEIIRSPGTLSSSCKTYLTNYRRLVDKRNKEMDFGVWQVTATLPMRPLLKYFNTRASPNIDGVCTMISKSREKEPLKLRTLHYIETTVDNTIVSGPGSMHLVKEATKQGDCTSPIITHTQPHLIIGMHCASNASTKAYAFTICREDIEEAISKFPTQLQPEGGVYIPYSEYGALRDSPHGVDLLPVEDLHPNSNARYVAQNGTPDVWFEVHGDVPGLRVKPKTRVQYSPLSKYYEEAGLQRQHTKPKFASDRDHSEYFQIGIRGMHDIEPTLLAWAQRDYIAPLLESFTELKHPSTRVLSLTDALNGIRDLRYIKRINEKTSGGLGYAGQKTQHMETTYVKGVKTFTPSEYLVTDVDTIMAQLSKGKMVGPVGRTCLKDEPVKDQVVDLANRLQKDPDAKMKFKRNRVFFVYDFAFFIVGKMLFISVIECLYATPLTCEMLQGCNVTTDEWTQIRDFAIGFNPDKVLEGDFSKMDTRLSAQLINAAGVVLTTLARHMGYTEIELTMMQTYVQDLALSVYAYNGTLVVLGGWNPSGNILTIVINGIANSLMHRCAYRQQLVDLGKPVPPFRENIHLTTVGDDSLGSVAPPCPFSMTYFQGWCDGVNMGYTDGEKNRVAKLYQEWMEATLCKRQFRWEERVNNYVAPLALASLYKSLHCQMESTTDAMTVAVNNADSALRELARHDETVFNEHRAKIKLALEAAEVDHMVPHLDLDYEAWWSILKHRHYVFPEEGPDIPDSSSDLEEDE